MGWDLDHKNIGLLLSSLDSSSPPCRRHLLFFPRPCLLPAPRSAASCCSRTAAVSHPAYRLAEQMADLPPLSSLVRSNQTGAGESRRRGQEAAVVGSRCGGVELQGEEGGRQQGKRTCRLWFVMENTTARTPLPLLLWSMDSLWVSIGGVGDCKACSIWF